MVLEQFLDAPFVDRVVGSRKGTSEIEFFLGEECVELVVWKPSYVMGERVDKVVPQTAKTSIEKSLEVLGEKEVCGIAPFDLA